MTASRAGIVPQTGSAGVRRAGSQSLRHRWQHQRHRKTESKGQGSNDRRVKSRAGANSAHIGAKRLIALADGAIVYAHVPRVARIVLVRRRRPVTVGNRRPEDRVDAGRGVTACLAAPRVADEAARDARPDRGRRRAAHPRTLPHAKPALLPVHVIPARHGMSAVRGDRPHMAARRSALGSRDDRTVACARSLISDEDGRKLAHDYPRVASGRAPA